MSDLSGTAAAVPSSLNPAVADSGARKSRHPGLPAMPSIVPGLALAVAVACAALVLGQWMSLLGAPIVALTMGMLIRNVVGTGAVFQPGLRFASRHVLQWSIVALGFGLSLQQVARTGLDSLTVTLATVMAAFVSAWLLGRWLRIPSRLGTLIGVGTAICGGSAIAAVTPIIKPQEHETAFAITTIFIFNIVAVLLFPFMGHVLGMSDEGFGLWAGTAINDTSSVVAAAYGFSNEAGYYATIVKLTRATLIIPICLALIAFHAWRHRSTGAGWRGVLRSFPWFIAGFVAAAALRSSGAIPEALDVPLQALAGFLILVALGAIGLSSDLRRMRTAGARPVLLGLGVWMSVVLTSLYVQYLLGRW